MKKIVRANLLLFFCMGLMTFGNLLLFFLPPKIEEAIPEFLFILLPSIVYIKLSNKNIKETLRLNPLKFKDILILILITVAMIPAIQIISTIASSLFGDVVGEYMNETSRNYSFPFLLFSIAITPAICEEVLMRGIVLDGYRILGMKKAIILNGVLFGMFHMNFHQFSYAFFMGMALATAVYFTNSIFAGMIIHFINNGTSVVVSYAITKGLINMNDTAQASSNTSGFSAVTILQYAAIITVSAFLTYLLFKALKKSNSEKIKAIETEAIKYRKDNEKVLTWSFFLVFMLFFFISVLSFFLLHINQ